ncbi:MAG: DUF3824 domain-containing protein [Puniceicoccales bacterium]|jgi:hypothetical protein|nr:DUF3824 domain-containing protein [Puniceicoccales bacterium]
MKNVKLYVIIAMLAGNFPSTSQAVATNKLIPEIKNIDELNVCYPGVKNILGKINNVIQVDNHLFLIYKGTLEKQKPIETIIKNSGKINIPIWILEITDGTFHLWHPYFFNKLTIYTKLIETKTETEGKYKPKVKTKTENQTKGKIKGKAKDRIEVKIEAEDESSETESEDVVEVKAKDATKGKPDNFENKAKDKPNSKTEVKVEEKIEPKPIIYKAGIASDQKILAILGTKNKDVSEEERRWKELWQKGQLLFLITYNEDVFQLIASQKQEELDDVTSDDWHTSTTKKIIIGQTAIAVVIGVLVATGVFPFGSTVKAVETAFIAAKDAIISVTSPVFGWLATKCISVRDIIIHNLSTLKKANEAVSTVNNTYEKVKKISEAINTKPPKPPTPPMVRAPANSPWPTPPPGYNPAAWPPPMPGAPTNSPWPTPPPGYNPQF